MNAAMRFLLPATLLLFLATPTFAQDDDLGWPRLYDKGTFSFTAYQPQVDSWKDYKRLKFRMALEFTRKGEEKSTFAALTVSARTKTDFTARTVALLDMKIAEVSFPHADSKEQKEYRAAIKERLSQKGLVVSLDRMLAIAEKGDQVQRDVKIARDAPPIFYSDVPAVLVNFTGQPATQPIAGTKLRFAVNTNWTVIAVEGEVGAYLLINDGWVHARKPAKGPWTAVDKLPDDFMLLPDDESWKDVRANIPGKKLESIPKVFVSLRPAEMIETDGAPSKEPIDGTQIEWVVNTDSDLFWHTGEKAWFFLVAGRWFKTDDLKTGRWTGVDDPPADFAKIPDEHERADVMASVSGTDAAEEALVQASIPRKASVKREGTTIDVEWDGEPVFEDIEGATGVAYAQNTPDNVLRVEGRFYCVRDGVWFVSSSPNGPWVLCDKVPAAIYTIPIDHPMHNVVYVYVYESDDDEVVYGYTSGYYGCYVWRRRCYFGGGYWWGFRRGLRWHRWYHWRYRPAHYGYGMRARYSFHRSGWVRGARLYGPYGGVGRGADYRPRTKTYARGAAMYGPRGGRYAKQAYNPATLRHSARAGSAKAARSGAKMSSVYGAWGGNRVTARDDAWARKTATKANTRSAARTAQAAGRKNNVFVGKDGKIYKHTAQGWNTRGKQGWNRPGAAKPRPNVNPRAKQPRRTQAQVNKSLQRQRYTRTRGNTRSRSYSSSRARSSYRSRGGGSRGGGGRGGGGRRR